MIVSAGQLHSSAKLLELIASTSLGHGELASNSTLVLVCPVGEILNLCSRCGWVEVDMAGKLRTSPRGELLRTSNDFQERLRMQLRDVVITLQPGWSKLLMHGRHEMSRFAPPDISQCFKEAGLFSADVTDQLVRWWDDLGSLARGFRSANAMEVGRAGERLTLAFERDRTLRKPVWQSIESAFSGYDVLSVVASDDSTPMQIEVKASALRLKDAFLYLSENEWKSAQDSRAHKFHLWHIGNPNQLAIVELEEMRLHIPLNHAEGMWQSVKIPFRAFLDRFKQL